MFRAFKGVQDTKIKESEAEASISMHGDIDINDAAHMMRPDHF